MLRVRLTDEPDGAIALESPYDDFNPHREHFKTAIPWDGRSWDGQRKKWLVKALYVEDLLSWLQHVGATIRDDRLPREAAALLSLPPMPDDLRQAFDTLHLAYTAPLGVAEASFKFLAKAFHPDKGGNVEYFHAINDAIAIMRHYLQESLHDSDPDLPF